MPDHDAIYAGEADRYDLLVSREDCRGSILPALLRTAPLAGASVVELGAGTGRVTRFLAPLARFIYAFDRSRHMLDLASRKLGESGLLNCRLAVCDHRSIPAGRGIADAAIAGWSICYLVAGIDEAWKGEVDRALDEMRRVVRPGGAVILLETLGTGCESPEPPAELTSYYAHLGMRGFRRTWIRTDYRFHDLPEAEALTRFFFGDLVVKKIVKDARGPILPECTGIWSAEAR